MCEVSSNPALPDLKMSLLNALSRIVSRRPVAGELGVALAVKIALLVLASIFLFGSDHRVHVDEIVAARRIFGQELSLVT